MAKDKTPVSTKQPKVFLSYTHGDRQWADRLLIHLRAFADKVEVWSDSQIAVGASWSDEITKAISSADVAILLVSADYIASAFITELGTTEAAGILSARAHSDSARHAQPGLP